MILNKHIYKKTICFFLVLLLFSTIQTFAGGGKDNPENRTQYDLGTGQQIPRKISPGDTVMQLFNKFYYSILEVMISVQKKLLPYARALFVTLMTLEVVYFGLMVMLGESNNWGAVIKKFFQLGVMTYVFFSFPQLAKMFKDSLIAISSLGVNTGNYGDNPGLLLYDAQENIINPFILSLKQSLMGEQGVTGWDVINPINAVKDIVLTIWTSVLTFFLTILIQIPFIIIAIQICLANFELQIISAYVMIIFPFMIFSPLAFISKNGIATVLSASLKLSVSIFVGSLAMSGFMALFKPGAYAGFDFFFILIATLCLMAYLAIQAPNLASTILTGMPSLSFAGALQNAVGTVKAIKWSAGKISGAAGGIKQAIQTPPTGNSSPFYRSFGREFQNTTTNNTSSTQTEKMAEGQKQQETARPASNTPQSDKSASAADDKAAAHVNNENTSGDQ